MLFASAPLSDIENRAGASPPCDIPQVKRRSYWETILGPSTVEPFASLMNVNPKSFWGTILNTSTQPVLSLPNANPKSSCETALVTPTEPASPSINVKRRGYWETVLGPSVQPLSSTNNADLNQNATEEDIPNSSTHLSSPTNVKQRGYWETVLGPSVQTPSTNNAELNQNAGKDGIPSPSTHLPSISAAVAPSTEPLLSLDNAHLNQNAGNSDISKLHPPVPQYPPLSRSFSVPDLLSAPKPPSRPIPAQIPTPVRPPVAHRSRYFPYPRVVNDCTALARDSVSETRALNQNPFSSSLGFGTASQGFNPGYRAYGNRRQYTSARTGTGYYDAFGNISTRYPNAFETFPWAGTSQRAAAPTRFAVQDRNYVEPGSDDWVNFSNHGSTFNFGHIAWNRYTFPKYNQGYTPLDTSSDPIYDPATDPSTAFVASISKPAPGTTYLPSPPSTLEDSGNSRGDGGNKERGEERRVPLRQPQPVRPISIIPFSELALAVSSSSPSSSSSSLGFEVECFSTDSYDDVSPNASVSSPSLSESYYSMDTCPSVSPRPISGREQANESYYRLDGSLHSGNGLLLHEGDACDAESYYSVDTSPDGSLGRFSDEESEYEDAQSSCSMDTSSDDEEEEEEGALQLDKDEFYARLYESYRRATVRYLESTVPIARPSSPSDRHIGGLFCDCGCSGTIHSILTLDESDFL